MTEDKHNNSEKASRKRPPKSRHIDVRFTEDEFNIVLKYARMSGRSKSIYLHDVALGHKPSLPMTAEEQEALKGLIGARAELIDIRNASCFAAGSQEETIQESRRQGAVDARHQFTQ